MTCVSDITYLNVIKSNRFFALSKIKYLALSDNLATFIFSTGIAFPIFKEIMSLWEPCTFTCKIVPSYTMVRWRHLPSSFYGGALPMDGRFWAHFPNYLLHYGTFGAFGALALINNVSSFWSFSSLSFISFSNMSTLKKTQKESNF